jgi:hypothetical protein
MPQAVNWAAAGHIGTVVLIVGHGISRPISLDLRTGQYTLCDFGFRTVDQTRIVLFGAGKTFILSSPDNVMELDRYLSRSTYKLSG